MMYPNPNCTLVVCGSPAPSSFGTRVVIEKCCVVYVLNWVLENNLIAEENI